MSKIIKLKINSAKDRVDIIIALANSGYKVWVEKEEHKSWRGGDKYFVVLELKKLNGNK